MTTYSPNKLFFISGVSFLLGLIGVFLYCLYFSVNSLRQSLLLLFLILGVGVLIFYWSSRKYLGLMIFCCFCLGAARWLLIQPQLKPVNLDTLNRLEAMVLSAEDKDGRYQQLIVKPVNKILSKYQALLIRTDSYPIYQKGDIVIIKGQVKLVEQPFYSHNSWISSEANWPEIQLMPQRGFSFWLSVGRVRKYLASKINSVLNEPQAGFLRSLLFGRRSNLSKKTGEILDKAGLSHLVAVSGLHLSLISAMLLRIFDLVPAKRQFKLGGVMVCLVCFAALADFTPSVNRSLIMTALMFLAASAFRVYSSLTALLFAGMIMVFINPLILFFDFGFQLSFLAALGIILFYSLFRQQDFWQQEIFRGWLGILRDTLLTSLSSLILVSPWLIFKTTKITTVALLSNVLVVPIISWVSMLGLATIVLAIVFSPLALLGGFILNALLSYIIKISQILISLPVAQFYISPKLNWIFLLAYPLILGVYCHYKKQQIFISK